eukprot:symbB.v1.2.015067.t1/scaffold1096.1/size138270/3
MTEGSGGGGGSRPSTSAPALPAPPAKGERGKGANGEEKLRRKIEWLNNNVCKNDILKTDREATTANMANQMDEDALDHSATIVQVIYQACGCLQSRCAKFGACVVLVLRR